MFNYGSTIRQAVITGFSKTAEALPAGYTRLAHVAERDLWRDWSAQVRGVQAGRYEIAEGGPSVVGAKTIAAAAAAAAAVATTVARL